MAQLKGWRGLLVKGALLLATIFFALGSPRYVPFITTSENWASDWRISLFNPSEEPHPQIVILAITEDTLATFPYRFPVDRGFLADLIEVLNAAGARIIALDILFDQPTEARKDERLRKVLTAGPLSGRRVPFRLSSAGRIGKPVSPISNTHFRANICPRSNMDTPTC